MHPLRRNAPDQKRCNAYGSGAPPPTTSPTAGNSPPQTPTVHLGRCDTASTCSPSSERDALHPLRRGTPVTSRYTRYVAMHPLRRDTPVTSQCTRSEGVQCLRIGCTASHNKHNRGQFVPTDPNRPPRTLRHSFDMLARLRTRGATPVTSRYTRYVAIHPIRRGAMPTDRV